MTTPETPQTPKPAPGAYDGPGAPVCYDGPGGTECFDHQAAETDAEEPAQEGEVE